MANLKLVADAMFYNKNLWSEIPDEEKELCFFIINRMFSKKYPEKAQLLNGKLINKVSAMNLWYSFMLDKPYPKWFWSKSPAENKKSNKSDIDLLVKKLKVKEDDIIYLIDHHPDFIKEELAYYKKIEK